MNLARRTVFYIPFFFLTPLMAFTADQVLDNSKKAYRTLSAAVVKYKCVIEWKFKEEPEKSQGVLFLKKPNKYYLEAGHLFFCTDGVTFWQYSGKNRQVIIRDLIDAADAFKIPEIFFNFSENYSPQKMELKKGGYEVTLTPKNQSSPIHHLKVTLDPKTWFPTRILLVDLQGNETLYAILDIKTGVAIPDSRFDFNIPDNVDVEDLRE